MSKEKTYNSLEAFAEGWKQENPRKSVKSKKVTNSKKFVDIKEVKEVKSMIDNQFITPAAEDSDDGTFIIRIPM
jgi:hypothetical protein